MLPHMLSHHTVCDLLVLSLSQRPGDSTAVQEVGNHTGRIIYRQDQKSRLTSNQCRYKGSLE